MGLDLVEFVFAIEDCFSLAIPNEVAATFTTPRRVIDYLDRELTTLRGSDDAPHLLSRAFYRIRSTFALQYALPRGALRPETLMTSILPRDSRSQSWRALRGALGANPWPQSPTDNVLLRYFPVRPRTIGDLARYLARTQSVRLLDRSEHWNRSQIEELVRLLVEDEFGVARTSYTIDSSFVHDLHVD